MDVEQVTDVWFCRLISAAALAGSCRIWARREPDAAGGLNRLADKQSAAVTDALTEFAEGQPNWRELPSLLAQPGGRDRAI